MRFLRAVAESWKQQDRTSKITLLISLLALAATFIKGS